MNHHDEQYSSACAGYAVGSLDGSDLKEFEAHLKEGCAICIANTADLREAAALLPVTLTQLSPSHGLNDRIEFSIRLSQVVKATVNKKDETVEEETSSEKETETIDFGKSRYRAILTGVLIGMIIVLIGFCVYIYSLFTSLNQQKKSNDVQQLLLTKSIEELEQKNAILGILNSKNLELIQLHAAATNPYCYGQILHDVNTNYTILHTVSLPPAADGKEYKVWLLIDKQTIFSSKCSVLIENPKDRFYKLNFTNGFTKDDIKEIYLTLEKKDGSISPHQEKILTYQKNKTLEIKRGN